MRGQGRAGGKPGPGAGRAGWVCAGGRRAGGEPATGSALACTRGGREGSAPGREGAAGLKATPAGGDPDSSLRPERARLRAAQRESREPSAPGLPRHEHPDKALNDRSDVGALGSRPQVGAPAGAAAGAGRAAASAGRRGGTWRRARGDPGLPGGHLQMAPRPGPVHHRAVDPRGQPGQDR